MADNAQSPSLAVGSGGPLDGAVLGDGNAAESAAEYEVVLADNSRHRYLRTDRVVSHGNDQARVFSWAGRR